MSFEKIEVPKVKKVVKNDWELSEFATPDQKDTLDYASVQTGQAYDEAYIDGAEIGTSFKEKELKSKTEIDQDSFEPIDQIQDEIQGQADAETVNELFQKRNNSDNAFLKRKGKRFEGNKEIIKKKQIRQERNAA